MIEGALEGFTRERAVDAVLFQAVGTLKGPERAKGMLTEETWAVVLVLSTHETQVDERLLKFADALTSHAGAQPR